MAIELYGKITVSGKFKNIKNFILNGIGVIHEEGTEKERHTVEEQPRINKNGFITGNNGHKCREWLWIKNTNCHFSNFYKPFNVNACNDDDDSIYDFDIKAFWAVGVEELAKISARDHVNFKSNNIENPKFKQEFEIKNGEIITNEIKIIEYPEEE